MLGAAAACGLRGVDAHPEVLLGGWGRSDGWPYRAQRASAAGWLDRARDGHPCCDERLASDRHAQGAAGEARAGFGLGSDPAAARERGRFGGPLPSFGSRPPPRALTQGRRRRGLFFCSNVIAPKLDRSPTHGHVGCSRLPGGRLEPRAASAQQTTSRRYRACDLRIFAIGQRELDGTMRVPSKHPVRTAEGPRRSSGGLAAAFLELLA
jgi:hypothetical protein